MLYKCESRVNTIYCSSTALQGRPIGTGGDYDKAMLGACRVLSHPKSCCFEVQLLLFQRIVHHIGLLVVCDEEAHYLQ